jgi:asparagine synthase (glutamine-hydrolysing)
MCGIVGFVDCSEKNDISHISQLTNMLDHRGPDYLNYQILERNFYFGHARLKILDLTDFANQPFSFLGYTIVYNGEVYNFKHLKSILQARGYSFSTKSDTEVIIKLFAEFGVRSFTMLEGMFSLAIYDSLKKELYIARDFFGQKPLFYSYVKGKYLIFASEIKVILKYLSNNKVQNTLINKSAINKYLNRLYVPQEISFFSNISSLKANSFLVFNVSNIEFIEEQKIKNISFQVSKYVHPTSYSDLKSLLVSSVESQLISSDLSVGLWLSGGIDSSLISAIARRDLGVRLNTITIGFENSQFHDESSHAIKFAKECNHLNTKLNLSLDINEDYLDELISNLDIPVANPSMVMYDKISKATKSVHSVILTGTGGDELFGGYNRYRALRFRKLSYFKYLINLLPFSESRDSNIGNKFRALKKVANLNGKTFQESYFSSISYAEEFEKFSHDYFHKFEDEYNDIMQFDISNYLVSDLLYLTDLFSMKYALEVRSPFLNFDLFQLAFSFSSFDRMGSPGSKSILRSMLKEYTNGKFEFTRKRGFAFPIESYLRNYTRKNIINLLKYSNLEDIVPMNYISKVVNGFYLHKQDYVNQLFSLYVLSKFRILKNINL